MVTTLTIISSVEYTWHIKYTSDLGSAFAHIALSDYSYDLSIKRNEYGNHVGLRVFINCCWVKGHNAG